MKTLYVNDKIEYNGRQLAPHWIYNQFDILGDAIVAFTGPCNVTIDNMVDLADVHEEAFIYSPLMLNFISEHFDNDLRLAVYRQRMLMVCIKEELELFEIPVNRLGDDLYVDKGKLSVSIATVSTVSSLIHTGLNIRTEGTPVKTAGLAELGIQDIKSLAENIMLRYKREVDQIEEARCKVRGLVVES